MDEHESTSLAPVANDTVLPISSGEMSLQGDDNGSEGQG